MDARACKPISYRNDEFRTLHEGRHSMDGAAPDMPRVDLWRKHLTLPIISSLSRAVGSSRHSKTLVSCHCQLIAGHAEFRSAVAPREYLEHIMADCEVIFLVSPSCIAKRERSHHASRLELFMVSASRTLAAPALGLCAPFGCHAVERRVWSSSVRRKNVIS